MNDKEYETRWLVRYKFTNSEEVIGIYRNAPTLKQAFEDEKKNVEFLGQRYNFYRRLSSLI